VPRIYEKEFVIEIDNLDSPPLKIETVKFQQLVTYLIADFVAGKKYEVVMGDKNLQAPKYDLAYFKDKIDSQLPFAYVGKVEPIEKASIVSAPVSFWQQKWFMWMCIGVGALIVFFFSLNLLKDMQSKKEI
jgi:hypothetical protein